VIRSVLCHSSRWTSCGSAWFVINVVAKKCRSEWKVPCSFGQPAASRQPTRSRDQVRSVNGLPRVVVNTSGTVLRIGSPDVMSIMSTSTGGNCRTASCYTATGRGLVLASGIWHVESGSSLPSPSVTLLERQYLGHRRGGSIRDDTASGMRRGWQEQAWLERPEGNRDVGVDMASGDLAGIRVDSARKVDGDDRNSSGDRIDELIARRLKAAGAPRPTMPSTTRSADANTERVRVRSSSVRMATTTPPAAFSAVKPGRYARSQTSSACTWAPRARSAAPARRESHRCCPSRPGALCVGRLRRRSGRVRPARTPTRDAGVTSTRDQTITRAGTIRSRGLSLRYGVACLYASTVANRPVGTVPCR
jgi:hypothetical protein